MAPQKLTDYERQRLENIRRNDEMMAALMIHSKVNDLSAKRRRAETKSSKKSSEKKVKTESPIVIRRSLRTRGIKIPKISYTSKPSPLLLGPLSMSDVYGGDASDRILIETIVGVSRKSQQFVKGNGNGDVGSPDLTSLTLEPDNIARIMPSRILTVKFLPFTGMNMIVAGNQLGDVAFWNVDAKDEQGGGIYLYHPHTGPVSGISVQPYSSSKIFTCCYSGFIRSMDAEKEVFDLVYRSDESIFSLSQQQNDRNCLYFSEGKGGLNIWDEREGKPLNSWMLHEGRINTIDFNPSNTNNFVTSSTDKTICIWDLRRIGANKPKSLKTHVHRRSVHSAYFSPSGSCIATTSHDNTVAILSGVNFEDISKIKHYNQTGRGVYSFRGIWGWDDSHVFIGNMNGGVDTLSTANRTTVKTLWSEHMSAIPSTAKRTTAKTLWREHMSAIPSRFAAHPFKVGMLAGATGGGQIYIWTSC